MHLILARGKLVSFAIEYWAWQTMSPRMAQCMFWYNVILIVAGRPTPYIIIIYSSGRNPQGTRYFYLYSAQTYPYRYMCKQVVLLTRLTLTLYAYHVSKGLHDWCSIKSWSGSKDFLPGLSLVYLAHMIHFISLLLLRTISLWKRRHIRISATFRWSF
jgi:hypothetical protein